MKAPWSALAATLLLAPALAAPGTSALQPVPIPPRPEAHGRLLASASRPANGNRPANGSRPANGNRSTNGSRPANGSPLATGSRLASAPPRIPTPAGSRQGERVQLNGREQRASWLLLEAAPTLTRELWLPLELLQDQLGFHSTSRPDGTLELEWFGRTLLVPVAQQRSLDDEVAVEVANLLRDSGVSVAATADLLSLTLPPPRLLQVRLSRQPGPRRIVLDLEAPALLGREGSGISLAMSSSAEQQQRLQAMGLPSRRQAERLLLSLGANDGRARVFTLGNPARVVIDLPAAPAAPSSEEAAAAPLDPRLQTLLGRSVIWDRRDLELAGRRFRLNAISVDPRSAPLELRPLRRDEGMEGLSLLPNLARRWDALVAINGGYFNRIRRLPLGALREQGRWLSGPILNRGAVGWEPGQLPRFGRLQLQEWLIDRQGGRWPLAVLNSGYVQRGLSRYTVDWGPWYRAISNGESAVRLREGQVVETLSADQLAAGVPLRAGEMLVVGRGGSVPPWSLGDSLQLESRPSDPLGAASSVIGGGPLLLREGRVVLQGAAEGFSGAFLSQAAPRTVIASDGSRLLLLTLEGRDHPGPTLGETALLLQRLGVREALNLDGGSSTGLVMGGNHAVRGRGVAAAIHHGLGLVLRPESGGSPPPSSGPGSGS